MKIVLCLKNCHEIYNQNLWQQQKENTTQKQKKKYVKHLSKYWQAKDENSINTKNLFICSYIYEIFENTSSANDTSIWNLYM